MITFYEITEQKNENYFLHIGSKQCCQCLSAYQVEISKMGTVGGYTILVFLVYYMKTNYNRLEN